MALVSTYPGTPASEIGDRFYEISRQTDLYFEYSVNEKVALEVAAGAAASGLRAMCSMKHVGVNVAADTFMTLAYVGVKGGLVIVSGRRPVALFQPERAGQSLLRQDGGSAHAGAGRAQEAKEMTRAALPSRKSWTAGAPAHHHPHQPYPGRGDLGRTGFPAGPGPFCQGAFHQGHGAGGGPPGPRPAAGGQAQAAARAETSPFNQIRGKGNWGMVTSGVSSSYVEDALAELGLQGRVQVLKLGFTHPLPVNLILRVPGSPGAGAGGGGTGTFPGGRPQGHGPGPRSDPAYPGERPGPVLPPL